MLSVGLAQPNFKARIWRFIGSFSVGLLIYSQALAGINGVLIYQGRVVRPDGTVPNTGSLTFTLSVYSPSPSKCLLYSETQIVSMVGSQGMFSLQLGAGSRVDGGSHTFNQVFTNGATLSGLTCASGSSYTAGATDDRSLSVSFNDAGTVVNLSAMAIKSVPFALQAHEVDGWGLNNLVKVSSIGSPSTFTTSEMANVKSVGAAACATNEILKWNGSAWACSADATGSAPGDAGYTGSKGIVAFDTDAATSGITVASGIAKLSNTGVSAATYGTASKVASVAVNAQGRITSASEISISIPASQITQSGAAVGEVLKWNGSAWLPAADATGTSPGDATYAAKGLVQADTDAATSGLNLSSGVISVNTGTGANQIVKLDASSKLPAVDGSALTNLSASQISAGTLPVSRGGTGSTAALTNNKVMVSSGGAIVEGSGFASTNTASTFVTRDASGNFAAGTGTFDSLKMNGSVSGTLTFTVPSSFTGYSLNWPTADGSAGQFLKTDGSGNLSWASASSVAITSLNGSTVSTQTFATPGTSGTAPDWSTNTGTGVHTLNIPMASTASVTAGLISKTDYDAFNNKLGTGTSFSGDVSGTYNATSVDKIKGTAVSVSSLTSGDFLRYNGSAWVNSVLSSGDITTALGYTPVNRAGDTMSGALNLGGNNISNVNQLSLKDSGSNTVTLKAPTTVGANYSLVLPTADGSAGQFLKTDGSGNLSWATSATPGDATYSAKGIVQFDTDAATSGITVASGVASVNAGTGANQIVKLDGTSKLPAVDGSALTNLNANNIVSGTLPIARGGTGASTKTAAFDALSPLTTKGDVIVFDGTNNIRLPAGSNGQVLTADSAQASGVKWSAAAAGTVTSITGGTGLTGGTITSVGTLAVDVGTGANQIVQLDASSKLPAVDGSALTNLSTTQLTSGTLPIARGGTGASSFAANNLIGTNGTGTAMQAVTCAQNQVLSFDASGNYGCYNLSSLASGTYFANGGNSFAGAATLGTNDANTLALKTNNTTRLTIDTAGNVGIGTASPGAPLDVNGEIRMSGATSGYAGFKSPATGPSVTWTLPTADGSAGQFLKTDGAGNLSWATASAGGITSLNGLSASSQTFAIGTSGTAPAFSSATSTHTLNIPMASTASVTAGLISKTDYDAFNNKLGTSTSFSGDVSGTYNATSVDKIKGTTLSISALASGNFLKYNGSAWVNSILASSDVTTALAYTPVNRAGDTMSGALNMNGQSISNVGSLSLKGSTSGTLSMTVPSTVTSYTIKWPSAVPASGGQVLTSDTSGNLSWTTVASAANTFANGGNSFGAAATLGTNDNYGLSFRTNNSIRMTLDTAGNLGVGTNSPQARLDASVSDATNYASSSTTTNFPVPTASGIPLYIANYGSGSMALQGFYTAMSGSQWYQGIAEGGTNYSGSFVLGNRTGTTAYTERMRIDSSGNVGIGTASPGAKTHIVSSGGQDVARFENTATTGALLQTQISLAGYNGTTQGVMGGISATGGTWSYGAIRANEVDIWTTDLATGGIALHTGVAPITFHTGNSDPDFSAEKMRIDSNGNVGIGTTSPGAPLDVKGEIRMSGATSGYTGFKSPAVGPSVTWTLPTADGSAGQFLKTDGAGNLSWATASAGGITSLNGLSASSQTFAIGASGTAPAFSSATSTHTLNIPMASTASVTAGLLSKTDYDAFNNKLGTSTSFSGDVSGAYNATSVDKIKGTPVSISSLTSGNYLKYNGSAWVNSALSVNASTDITSGTLPVSRGGTGASSFAANNLVGTNGTGTALQAVTCTQNQVISFDASGNYGCYNLSSIAGSTYFTQNGNSFAGNATLGTNDNYKLSFETNNSTRMTIDTAGKVGIGTTSPVSGGLLNLSTNSGDAKIFLDSYGTANPAIVGRIARGTIASPTATQAGDDLMYFGGRGYGTTGFASNSTAGIWLGAEENFTDTSQATAIMFETTPSGSVTKTERMRINSSGNVGIGTASPASALEVKGSGNSGNSLMTLTNTDSMTYMGAIEASAPNMSANQQLSITLGRNLATNNRAHLTYNYVGNGSTSNFFSFGFYNNDNIFNVMASGNVGIGDTNPSNQLSLVGAVQNVPQLSIKNTSTTGAYNYTSMAFKGTGRTFHMGVANSSETGYGVANKWFVYDLTADVFRMVIDSNGYTGIGNVSPSALLHVGSSSTTSGTTVAKFQTASGTCSMVPASSGSGISCSSDERLKKEIEEVPGEFALDRILKMQAVSYVFKKDESGQRHTGYIAQDLDKVAPEFVRMGEDGYYQVNYDGLIPWITEAIKSLHVKISNQSEQQTENSKKILSLEAEIQDLKEKDGEKDEKIESLERQLGAMKSYLCSKEKGAKICD